MGTLLYITSLCCFIISGLACVCDDQNEQEKFCRADWAIKTRIVAQKGMDSDDEHKYEIDLENTVYFKHTESVLNFTNVHIYSYSEYMDCAVVLQENQTYVITGHYRNPGKPVFNVCNFVQNWDSGLTDMQRNDFYNYDMFCAEEWHK